MNKVLDKLEKTIHKVDRRKLSALQNAVIDDIKVGCGMIRDTIRRDNFSIELLEREIVYLLDTFSEFFSIG